jgi:hypothetical protein
MSATSAKGEDVMTGKVVGYHPDIPEGTYTVKYCGYETGQSWNSKKVKVNFAIVEGEYEGIPLARYYNAIHIYDPIGPGGHFDVGDRCHLLKEFRSLLPNVRSTNEIELDLYHDKLIRVQVETINKTGTGEVLTASNQYSIIRKLIEIIPTSYA